MIAATEHGGAPAEQPLPEELDGLNGDIGEKTAHRTAVFPETPSGAATSENTGATPHTALRTALGERGWCTAALVRGAVNLWASDWVAPWRRPLAVDGMWRYARDGAWCASEAPAIRLAGRAYAIGVAIPVSVALYLAAWVIQRPGRVAALAHLATTDEPADADTAAP